MALRFTYGKKGVFFTFVACIFLSLLIFSTSVGHNYELRQKSFVMETRVDTMNHFVSDVEEDIERAAYIAGFRSLISLVEHVISTGEYISDVNSSFNELFLNGTIDGTNSSFLVNNTFVDWIDKIDDEASKINLIINFSINNISVTQADPWRIKIDVGVGINVSDEEEISSWNKNKVITSYVELDGFEDPIYVVETNGLVDNTVRRTNFSYFVSGTDISNLLEHTYGGYYIEFTGAPSYLMRLEGDFGSSAYGIESLVDIAELMSKGISAKDKSIVDYIYFGSNNPTKYHVSGAPSWFKLDNSSNAENNQTHLDLYEVNGLI
jgi:hypothetical protein